MAETIEATLFQVDREFALVVAPTDRAQAPQGISSSIEGFEQIVMFEHLLERNAFFDGLEIKAE